MAELAALIGEGDYDVEFTEQNIGNGSAIDSPLMDAIRGTIMQAVDSVMTCEPDYLIMGMSSETFWDGLEGSKRLLEPRVLTAGMVWHQVNEHPQTQLVSRSEHAVKIIQSAKQRINIGVITNVVARIFLWRSHEWRQPNCVNTECSK